MIPMDFRGILESVPSLDDVTGWLSAQWDNAAGAVTEGISGFTDWLSGGIDGAIDTATATVTGAVDAVAGGVSGAIDGAIDTATGWAADLIPDWVLPTAGLGGGGLLALLGFKLARGMMGRRRGAAEYALYKVPAALCEKVQSILQAAGITTIDGETLEGWATFSVARYHIGPTERTLRGLQVQWERVA